MPQNRGVSTLFRGLRNDPQKTHKTPKPKRINAFPWVIPQPTKRVLNPWNRYNPYILQGYSLGM